MGYPLLVCLTIFGWGFGAMACKIATNHVSPIMLAVITTAMYVVMMVPLFLFVKFDKSVNGTGMLFSLLGAAAMALGSVCYFFALQKGAAGITTILAGTYPSLTLLLSGLFLGEGITIKKVIGFAVVLVGSFIVIK
jgi:uncharacterized membrane protein